jgi:hypothetical protein
MHGRIVTGGGGDARQLLVAPDLEVLEGVRERDELPGRVGMPLEERAPVERAESHGCVLQRRRVAAERIEPGLNELGVLARLGEVVGKRRFELSVMDEARCALQQADRLLLDRVRVRDVFRDELRASARGLAPRSSERP